MTTETRAFEQGQRDARDGVEAIDRATWERYTGPMPDSVYAAYLDGRATEPGGKRGL